ncbi:MAG: DUF5686 family protein [Ekhidna sp.]
MKRLNLNKVVLVLTMLITYQSLFAQVADSVTSSKKKQKKMNVPQLLFNGVAVPDDSRNRSWFIGPVLDLLQYNTIEGLVFNPRVSMTQQLNEGKFYAIKPNLRYGFGSERLYGQVSTLYFYNPSRFGSFSLNGGNFVKQFDQKSTLTPFGNSYSTLLLKENYLKVYESTFLEISHSFSPIRNLQLTNHVFWSSRSSLKNLEKYNTAKGDYLSNVPVNKEVTRTAFDDHQVFFQQTEVRWQPNLSYEYERGKLLATNQSPAIILRYKSAHSSILGSDLSYQSISVGIEGNVQAGSLGEGEFSIEGGNFISKDSLSFTDFTHFQGNRTSYTTYESGTFQLLDYFTESTYGHYFRGHYTHKFGQLTNRRGINPFQPIIESNVLLKDELSYFELGIGLQGMTKPWRVSFYNSWQNGKHDRSEIRFGFVL